jgi:hypothetical protein
VILPDGRPITTDQLPEQHHRARPAAAVQPCWERARRRDHRQGMVSTEVPIELDAVPAHPHYHLLITAGPATFRVDVEGAAWAVSSDVDSKGLHMLGRAATPLYFQVPAGTEAFHLSLEGSFPGETVVGRLIAPDGREVEVFRAVERPIDRKRVSVGPNDAGWWKLLIEEAEVGVLDDYWVNLGNEIPGWLSIDPDRALSVRGR